MKNDDAEQAQPPRAASPQRQNGATEPVARPPDEQPPRSGLTDLTVACLSDTGRSREYQQDFAVYYVPSEPAQLAAKGALYIVADGMGGYQAGDVASQGAGKHVLSQYYADSGQDPGAALVRALRSASRLIYDQAQANPAYKGMGTTMVAAAIIGRRVQVASVGDSRAYLVDPGTIRQITEDHSWVGEQLRAGLLSPEKARVHPQRNVVTRALGSRPAVEVDLFEGEMGDEDILVLCTDGVTGHLEDQEIAALVRAHPAEEAARRVIDLANERGGHDNMTILLVSGPQAVASTTPTVAASLPAVPAPAPAPAQDAGRSRPSSLLLGLGAGAVILALLLGALWWKPWDSDQATATRAVPPADTAVPVLATSGSSATEPAVTVAAGTSVPLSATVAVEPPAPTSTLALALVTNTSPPAATQAPPRARATQTVAPRATPTPRPYPAPQLVAPAEGVNLQGVERFEWQALPLGPNDYYDLRFWAKTEIEASPNAPGRGGRLPSNTPFQDIDLRVLQPVRDHGANTYYWAVAVVHQRGPNDYRVVGQWSERRSFLYTPPATNTP